MSKQTGIISIEGSLDGLNFYMRNGKPVVRVMEMLNWEAYPLKGVSNFGVGILEME